MTQNAKPTPGPVAWQKFGKDYWLTGQYGMRPIIFGSHKSSIQNLVNGLLQPLTPEHPDSILTVAAFNSASRVEAMGFDGTRAVEKLPELIEVATFAAMRIEEGAPMKELKEIAAQIRRLFKETP